MLIPFLESLEERVLVCDGAMGTMLYAKGIFINKSFDALNVTQPDLVAEVHQEYVRAGADIVETNTFGANRIKLGTFGIADRLHAINEQGARIARHAAREQAYVAGAIGPLGIRIEPWGKTGVDEAREYFREQAQALADGGVDLFILETFRDLNEINAAIDAVRSVSDLPIVAQMTTEEDGNTLDGTPPERFTPELERRGATVIGVNCAVGPAPMLDTIERMAASTRRKLSAQPNAGKPRDVEGRNLYLCSPEYMASYARRFILHNVRVVGGCCGTTPEHIRQMKTAVRGLAPAVVRAGAPATSAPKRTRVESAISSPPVARERKSRLAQALSDKHFVFAVELPPPRGFQTDAAVERARRLKARGVDVISIPDGQRAGARLSALSLAVLVEQQAGIETVLQYCLPRSQPAGHSVGSARCARDGTSQRPSRDGGSRARRRLSGRDGRVRRRFHRADQRREPSQPRVRHRRPGDRGADGISRRRFGEPGGVEPRPGAAPFRLQGGSGGRIRHHATHLRRQRLHSVPETHRRRETAGAGRGIPLRKRQKRGIHGQRGAGRSGAGRSAGTHAAGGRLRSGDPGRDRDCRETAIELKGAVQGLQVSTPSGDIEAALAVLDGLR